MRFERDTYIQGVHFENFAVISSNTKKCYIQNFVLYRERGYIIKNINILCVIHIYRVSTLNIALISNNMEKYCNVYKTVRSKKPRNEGTRGKLDHSLRRSFYFEFILLWKRTSNVNSVRTKYTHLFFFLSFEEKEGTTRKRVRRESDRIDSYLIDRPSNERASTTNDTNEARTINEMEPLLSSSLTELLLDRSRHDEHPQRIFVPPPLKCNRLATVIHFYRIWPSKIYNICPPSI